MAKKTNHVISISGGKDSVAMALRMVERKEHIHSLISVLTGWEFPELYHVLNQVEKITGRSIVRLAPRYDFGYLMLQRPVRKRGRNKSPPYRLGYGWPSHRMRWCTHYKLASIHAYLKTVAAPAVECIGIAANESRRLQKNYTKDKRIPVRFPLAEWQMTETDALDFCQQRGIDFGDLYDHFSRVSCFCCPLSNTNTKRTLWRRFPYLWRRVLDMESRIPHPCKTFHYGLTAHELTRKFETEGQRQS